MDNIAFRRNCMGLSSSLRIIGWALAVSVCAPVAAQAGDVTVCAASSMTNAMAEIEQGFEAETGHDLSVSLAGSSALARQIQQGAPADVFISANPGWMDALEADGLLASGTRFDLLGNRIALIAHDAEAHPVKITPDLDLASLLAGGKLAMASVDSVPAGVYGKAALETLGLWADVAPHVAQTKNVRAALALVSLGEAPLGLVYATDAAAEDTVKVLGNFPQDSHPPIVYPAAGITGRDSKAAADFMTYLQSPKARAAFARQGFVVMAD